MEKYIKEKKKKETEHFTKRNEKENYRDSILKSYKQKLRDMDDRSYYEYKRQINELKNNHMDIRRDTYHSERRYREDSHYNTQEFDNIDEIEIRSSLNRLSYKLDSAEKRKSALKDKITRTAQEFSSRVPSIRQRHLLHQEKVLESQQIEFIKLNRKNANSYKRHEKYYSKSSLI